MSLCTVVRTKAETEPTLDLVHLACQTLGDESLEAELLALYRAQATLIDVRLEAAATDTSRAPDLADLAHMVKGSSLAIGAMRVARAATALEDLARSTASTSVLRSASRALRDALTEVYATIDLLLAAEASSPLAKRAVLP